MNDFMNIEELQQQWNAVKPAPKSHDDLYRMMNGSGRWVFKSVNTRELIRLALSALVMLALTLAFDLMNDLSTALPVVWASVLFVDEYIGFRYMRFLPQEATIRESLQRSLSLMQSAMALSRVAYALIWILMLLTVYFYFNLSLVETAGWALMLLLLGVAVTWWSSRKWTSKMGEVKLLLQEMNDEMEWVADNP